MTTQTTALQNLQDQMTAIAGQPVEITIRGLRHFTFSMDQVDEAAANRIAAFFNGTATITVEHDQECGTFVYCEV